MRISDLVQHFKRIASRGRVGGPAMGVTDANALALVWQTKTHRIELHLDPDGRWRWVSRNRTLNVSDEQRAPELPAQEGGGVTSDELADLKSTITAALAGGGNANAALDIEAIIAAAVAKAVQAQPSPAPVVAPRSDAADPLDQPEGSVFEPTYEPLDGVLDRATCDEFMCNRYAHLRGLLRGQLIATCLRHVNEAMTSIEPLTDLGRRTLARVEADT